MPGPMWIAQAVERGDRGSLDDLWCAPRRRAVPLQTIALEAIKQQPASRQSALLFPAERAGYLDLPMLPTIALAKVSCARVRRSGRAPLGGMRG